jgi:hypothetical protein
MRRNQPLPLSHIVLRHTSPSPLPSSRCSFATRPRVASPPLRATPLRLASPLVTPLRLASPLCHVSHHPLRYASPVALLHCARVCCVTRAVPQPGAMTPMRCQSVLEDGKKG